MSEITVEPTCNILDVEVDTTEFDVVVLEAINTADVEVINDYIVEAHINEWQIVNDMIYVAQEFGEIPPWLETAIDEILTDPDGLLIDSLEELKRLFDEFEEGYNARVISLENSDESQNTYITSLISRTDDNAAGIVRIDTTYASKYVAYASMSTIIGAYLNDGETGGAWFEQSVSAIADVAYSAARSASSLNASIISNTQDISDIWGSVEDLQKQADGLLTTWFIRKDDPGDGSYYDPVGPTNPDGTLNEDGKPYWCWVTGNTCEGGDFEDGDTSDTRALHTGDTYVWYEHDVDGNKVIVSTWRFGRDPDTDTYNWFVFTDDLASEAYQLALNAQNTADSKINTYYQSWAPTLADAGLSGGEAQKMNGDIWYDSDGEDDDNGNTININLMRRYSKDATADVPVESQPETIWHANKWVEVSDLRIEASVNRLDQATVTIDGVAVARSSLAVEATGSGGATAVAGYTASAESDGHSSQSKFRIFADTFEIANSVDSAPVFEINTDVVPTEISFTGSVKFNYDQIQNPPTIPPEQDLSHLVTQSEIATAGQTIINGANISTGFMSANHISASSIWTDGLMQSADYSWSGATGSPATGFRLDARQGTYWDIIGGNIYGSYIYGSRLNAGTIAFNGAKWESTCGENYTGNTGYTDSAYVSVPGGSGYNETIEIGRVVGTCYSSGHKTNRVLSTTSSRLLLSGNAYEYLSQNTTGKLQFMYSIGSGWVTVGPEHQFSTGSGLAGPAYPSITYDFPLSKVPSSGYVVLGIRLVLYGYHGATGISGNLNGSIILNN